MNYTREELEGKTDRTLMMMCQDKYIMYGRTRPSKGQMVNDLLEFQHKVVELTIPEPKAEEALEEFGVEKKTTKSRRKTVMEPDDLIIRHEPVADSLVDVEEGPTDAVLGESGPIGDGD